MVGYCYLARTPQLHRRQFLGVRFQWRHRRLRVNERRAQRGARGGEHSGESRGPRAARHLHTHSGLPLHYEEAMPPGERGPTLAEAIWPFNCVIIPKMR